LPRDAYVEYGYAHDRWHGTDPLNPRTVSNGLGAQNSYFYMPDAAPAPWTNRERGRPHGGLTRHVVHADHVFVGSTREVYLYQPPVSDPYPLLVVLDGPDYLRRSGLARMVDNLIAHGRIRPLGLAMVANGGQARYVEYACNDATVGFLRSVIVPLARAQLNLVDLEAQPGAFGVLGASMGGLCALYTALRLPAMFGRVISQSGAFALGSLRREPVVFDLVRNLPHQPLSLWMDVGTYEQLLPANRRMHALLRERAYDVTYREYAGGHNYTAWRDDVWRGLEAVYGASEGQGLEAAG
jgi:enterochelin esterase family protein